MMLSEAQQRWCFEHEMGIGYDDDDPELVQYSHVCEWIGGDGDAPRLRLPWHMTRKKLKRIRRVRNAYARLLSRSTGRSVTVEETSDDGTITTQVIQLTPESAHYWRERAKVHPNYEDRFPSRNPYCDGCLTWVGSQPHSTVFGNYHRELRYCMDCVASGHNDVDYERRTTAYAKAKPPLAAPPTRSVALCRSPRLWLAHTDCNWPATHRDRPERCAEITCTDCLRILAERGCPMSSESP